MAANPWYRFYHEFANDPKVQSMSESMQRRLVMLFCFRCSDVLATFEEQDIAFALRITEQDLAETKSLFIRKGFIDEGWNLRNWAKRQFVSDSSTERTRLYRERHRTSQERQRDAIETDAESETDTETESDKESAEALAPPAPTQTLAIVKPAKAPKGTRFTLRPMPEEWAKYAKEKRRWDVQQAQEVYDDFSDYWISKSGAEAVHSDWIATWRRWVRNQRAPPGQQQITGKLSFTESVEKVMRERVAEGRPPL